MQTFLPYPDFKQSAECLDYRRLGKQRVEAFQILNILMGRTAKAGWRNHPAVLMWRGYEYALAEYKDSMIREWIRRGYRNTMEFNPIPHDIMLPPWIGYGPFHASHRSNLLRKDPVFYGQYSWLESPDLPYVWPLGSPATTLRE